MIRRLFPWACIVLHLISGPPSGIAQTEVARLSNGLAEQVANSLKGLRARVLQAEGTRVLAELEDKGILDQMERVEFFRRLSGKENRLPLYERIGFGRILELREGLLEIELLSNKVSIQAGDEVRGREGRLGIGVMLASSALPDHRELMRLLSVRTALALEAQGRFRTEFLDFNHKKPISELDRLFADLEWKGIQFLLNLHYVEEKGEAVLVGRLDSLEKRETIDILSKRTTLGESWGMMVASLQKGQISRQGSPVEHWELNLGYQAVAQAFETKDGEAHLWILSRDALHRLSAQKSVLQESKNLRLPESWIRAENSRDLLGSLFIDEAGVHHLAHSLLKNSGLCSPDEPEPFQPREGPIVLEQAALELFGELEPGKNYFRQILVGSAPLLPASGSDGIRFAGWLTPDTILLQGRDYVLERFELANASRTRLPIASGAGVSISRGEESFLATTRQVVDDGEPKDQVIVFQLLGKKLEEVWRSPHLGSITLTALSQGRGILQVAALETVGGGMRAHWFSGIEVVSP